MQRSILLEMLKTYFNDSELRDICFALNVDHDVLAGSSKSDKARELLSYLERRNRLADLLKICGELRPQLSWHDEDTEEKLSQGKFHEVNKMNFDYRLGLQLLKARMSKSRDDDETKLDLLTLESRLLANLSDESRFGRSETLLFERFQIVRAISSLALKLDLDFNLLCQGQIPTDLTANASIQKLSDSELNLLYETGKELEKVGLLYEAAAKYWKIKQAHPSYRDVTLRLTVLEELSEKIFVGRNEELTTLMRLLERSLLGTSSVVFLSGEAGIGKTTLAYEFFRAAQGKYDRLIYAVGSCSIHSGFGESYLPFKEILALLCGEIESQLAQANVSITNAQRLSQIAPITTQLIPEITPNIIDSLVPVSLLEIKEAQYGLTQERRQKELQSFSYFESPISAFSNSVRTAIAYECSLVLRRLAERFPLIIFLDDLQWGDLASIDLLCYLATKLRDQPIMFVGAFRSEQVTKTKKSLENCIDELKIHFPETVEINLDETNETFVTQYVNHRYPHNRFPSDLTTQIQNHTGSNALFVSELFDLFEETRRIVEDEQGIWKFRGKFSLQKLPAKVETVIEKRIRSLTADLRNILEAASVEGEEFTAQIIAQLHRIGERDLIGKLSDELEKRCHLVTLSRSTIHQKQRLYIFRFRHALIRTYLYQSLHPVERELLHRDIGLFLESLYDTQLEKISPLLAEHFREANLPEKEISYRLMAAREATAVGAWEVAIYHLDQMEEKLDESIVVPDKSKMTMELYRLRGNLYALIPNPDKALGDFRQLENVAKAYTDNCFLAYAFCGYGVLERSLGNFEKAVEYVHQVEKLVSDSYCPGVIADCRLLAAKANKDLGRYEEVIKWAEKAQLGYEQSNNLRGVLDARSQVAYAHYARGQYDIAEGIWEANLLEAPEYANLPPDPDDDVYFCLGFLNWRLGKYEKAKILLSTALESAQQTNNKRKQAYCLNNLGFVETSRGNHAQAESILEEALAVFQELEDKKGQSWALGNLGNVLLYAGKFEDAIRFLKKNRALAEEINLRSDKAESSRRLSEAYLRSRNLPEAYRYARLGLQEGEDLGRRSFVGMIYRILGEIAVAVALQPEIILADIDDAEFYFEQSTTIARETNNEAEEILSLRAWGEYLIQLSDEKSQAKGQGLLKQAKNLDVEQ